MTLLRMAGVLLWPLLHACSPPPEPCPERPIPRSFMVKMAPGVSCPDYLGWAHRPAPETGTPFDAVMQRYCGYVFEQVGGRPASLPMDAIPDPAVVLPQGTIQYREHFNEVFLEGLGASFRANAVNVPDHARPWVAIIDTVEDRGLQRPRMSRHAHGLAMLGILQAIRCPGTNPGCDANKILFEDAFPPSLSVEDVDGEVRGTVWSLNLAVMRAIVRWRNAIADGTSVPLVLNLSLGWEWTPTQQAYIGQNFDRIMTGVDLDDDAPISPSEEALLLTLAWASCQQILSIAAVGNTEGSTCDETGKMAPAAWEDLALLEDLPRIDVASCDAWFDAPDIAFDAMSTDVPRLVYGAGGVEPSGEPIVNARPDSYPWRVLHASMTPSRVDGLLTEPWTGTSISTISLSALVAQLWGINPSTPASQVMREVDHSASSTPGSPPQIQADVLLPTLYEAVPPTTMPPPKISRQFQPPSNPVVLEPVPARSTQCQGRTVTTYSPPGSTSYSADTLWPELKPQPNTPICPTCPLVTNGSGAWLEIETKLDGRSLANNSALLEVHDATGVVEVFELDLTYCTDPNAGSTNTNNTPKPPDADIECILDLANFSTPTKSLATHINALGITGARLLMPVESEFHQPQLVGNEIDVR